MAYFAGNAFHISLKMRMFEAGHDSRQVCGAGILVEGNFFHGNIGLKKHNGGAGVIRCDHVDSKEAFAELGIVNSGLIRADVGERPHLHHHETLFDLDYTPTLANPTSSFIELDDFENRGSYSLLEYGTLIKDNTFANNYSGKKGSALLIERVSEL